MPADHIFGTEFRYHASGEIDTITRATAGYGKVAALDRLRRVCRLGRITSCMWAKELGRACDATCERARWIHDCGFRYATRIATASRTVLRTNALATLVPILEKIVGWQRPQLRDFFESYGVLIQEWDRTRTDWLTLRMAESWNPEAARAE